MDFAGYAVGGLSVGEEQSDMLRMIEATVAELPADRPRYLMGVGRPEDLVEAVARGVDLFDCVMPTRNGRNAMAFTDAGSLRLRNKRFELDDRPIQAGCPCAACRRSRGYIRHLFMAGEMLGPSPVVDPQLDLLSAADGRRPGGDRKRPVRRIPTAQASRLVGTGRRRQLKIRFAIIAASRSFISFHREK